MIFTVYSKILHFCLFFFTSMRFPCWTLNFQEVNVLLLLHLSSLDRLTTVTLTTTLQMKTILPMSYLVGIWTSEKLCSIFFLFPLTHPLSFWENNNNNWQTGFSGDYVSASQWGGLQLLQSIGWYKNLMSGWHLQNSSVDERKVIISALMVYKSDST